MSSQSRIIKSFVELLRTFVSVEWKLSVLIIGAVCLGVANESHCAELTERRFKVYEMVNVPIGYAVGGLNWAGCQICFELIPPLDRRWMVDRNGVGVTGTQSLVTIDKKNATVVEILQAIVTLHPEYRWTRVGESDYFNLIPVNSKMDRQEVGPTKYSGTLSDVLRNAENCAAIRYAAWRGSPGPVVKLNVGRVSARKALNVISLQHPRLVWYYGGSVSFSQFSKPTATSVRMHFPEMRPISTRPELFMKVRVRERRINGEMTVVADIEPN